MLYRELQSSEERQTDPRDLQGVPKSTYVPYAVVDLSTGCTFSETAPRHVTASRTNRTQAFADHIDLRYAVRENFFASVTMSQLKPPPHSLMTLPIDNKEEARHFFGRPKQLGNIRRYLTKGKASLRIDDVNRALEQISFACYRYKQAQQYRRPKEVVDAKWYGALQEAAVGLCAVLEEGDPRTVDRLLVAMGEEAEFKPDAPSMHSGSETDEEFSARQSRLHERGLVILNQQIKLLHWWQGAAKQAAYGAPTLKGRPVAQTPLLERSLVHELVDVWCTFHNEPYVAPKEDLSLPPIPKENLSSASMPEEEEELSLTKMPGEVREELLGGLFIATVLREAEFEFFTGLRIVRIGEVVRRERIKEWHRRESDPNYNQNRQGRKVSRHIPSVTLSRRR